MEGSDTSLEADHHTFYGKIGNSSGFDFILTVVTAVHFHQSVFQSLAGTQHIMSIQFGQDDIAIGDIFGMTFHDHDIAVKDSGIPQFCTFDMHGKQIFTGGGEAMKNLGITNNILQRDASLIDNGNGLDPDGDFIFPFQFIKADASCFGTSGENGFLLKCADVCKYG